MKNKVFFMVLQSGPLSVDDIGSELATNIDSEEEVYKAIRYLVQRGYIRHNIDMLLEANKDNMYIGYSPVTKNWNLYKRTFDYPRPEFDKILSLNAEQVVQLTSEHNIQLMENSRTEYAKIKTT